MDNKRWVYALTICFIGFETDNLGQKLFLNKKLIEILTRKYFNLTFQKIKLEVQCIDVNNFIRKIIDINLLLLFVMIVPRKQKTHAFLYMFEKQFKHFL